MQRAKDFILKTVREFMADDPFVLAGALSYYTLLSLAPLLLMIVSVAGLIYGEVAARGEVLANLEETIGTPAAQLAQDLLANAYKRGSGWLAATIAGVGVLVGATTALAQLQAALNKIWQVTPQKQPVLALLQARLMSLLFVMVLGAAVIASLVASSVLSALASGTTEALSFVWRLLDIAVPLGLMTVLFAMLYKLLPNATMRWRDVWVGAALTSLLFTIGRLLIGIYVGRAAIASPYGAAGSVVGLLVWVYYSSIIVLFGAEMTQVYARMFGAGVERKRFHGDDTPVPPTTPRPYGATVLDTGNES